MEITDSKEQTKKTEEKWAECKEPVGHTRQTHRGTAEVPEREKGKGQREVFKK